MYHARPLHCTQTAPILITQRLYPLLQAANSVRGSKDKEGAAAGKVFNISSPLGELPSASLPFLAFLAVTGPPSLLTCASSSFRHLTLHCSCCCDCPQR